MEGGERSRAPGRAALAGILLVSLVLNVVPFWWGLPAQGSASWAFDEIHPSSDGETSFSRHRGRYPPFHYKVLRVVQLPVRAIAASGVVDWSSSRSSTILWATGRLVSVLMTLGVVLVVNRLTWLVFRSARAANLAALLTAFSPTLVFYAKTVNLEAPYLLWVALSMLFFWLAIERHSARDYLLFGLTGALAICTKDQAAGLYPLPALALWLDLARHESGRLSWRSLASSLWDRRLLGGLAVAVGCFVLIHNPILEPGEFRHHLRTIFGDASERYRRWENSPRGHLEMALQAGRHLVFVLGLPAVVFAAAGLVAAALRHRKSLVLISFPLSYYLFFIVPIMYHYDRFVLPIALAVVIFAGLGLDWLPKKAVWRIATTGLLALVLTHALLRAITIDALMWNDARYSAEEWLREKSRSGEVALVLGSARQDGVRVRPFLDWARLRSPGPIRLRQANADYLVWNMDEAREQGYEGLAARLMDGRLNYRKVSVHTWAPRIDLLRTSGVYTNLSRVSPETVVARRVGDWGISGVEATDAANALWQGESADWQSLADAVWSSWFVKGRQVVGRETVAIGLGSDKWTRPGKPTFVAVHNGGNRSVAPVLRVHTVRRSVLSTLNVWVRYQGGDATLELASGEHGDIELPEIEPGETVGVLLVTEATENPESQPRRRRSARLERIR